MIVLMHGTALLRIPKKPSVNKVTTLRPPTSPISIPIGGGEQPASMTAARTGGKIGRTLKMAI